VITNGSTEQLRAHLQEVIIYLAFMPPDRVRRPQSPSPKKCSRHDPTVRRQAAVDPPPVARRRTRPSSYDPPQVFPRSAGENDPLGERVAVIGLPFCMLMRWHAY